MPAGIEARMQWVDSSTGVARHNFAGAIFAMILSNQSGGASAAVSRDGGRDLPLVSNPPGKWLFLQSPTYWYVSYLCSYHLDRYSEFAALPER